MVADPKPTKILLDCDPGIDDALAITLALGTPSAELVAITTVAGNVGLTSTTANAIRVCDFLGRTDVPITAGSAHALVRPNVFADYVHGADGLGGAPLPAAARGPSAGYGPDTIIETIAAAKGEITLVAVGPLTNIALALRKEPRIAGWVRELVIMGGSYTRGNVTPAAEFNIYVDPEAAAAVFAADWDPVLIGLDLTLQARVGPEVMDRWRGYGALSSELLVPSLGSYLDSRALKDAATIEGSRTDHDELGPAIHDACAVAYVLAPELFTVVPAHTDIEIHGTLTAGMTVVDFDAGRDEVNSHIATAIDVPAFWTVMETAFEANSARMIAAAQSTQ